MKIIRKIVKIDEEKCNGCGLCVPSCHEGAIQIVNGKAKVVKESYCDGLGACLGECPQDAITLEEREAEVFDAAAAEAAKHVPAAPAPAPVHAHAASPCGCPGSRAMAFAHKPAVAAVAGKQAPVASELQQWPVQLQLVPVQAPYWADADLLIAADCVAVAFGDFQQRLLKNKKVIIACPKLDNTENYVDKLANIFMINSIKSVTVAFMEVPCCSALVRIVRAALEQSGKTLPLHLTRIGLEGGIEELAE